MERNTAIIPVDPGLQLDRIFADTLMVASGKLRPLAAIIEDFRTELSNLPPIKPEPGQKRDRKAALAHEQYLINELIADKLGPHIPFRLEQMTNQVTIAKAHKYTAIKHSTDLGMREAHLLMCRGYLDPDWISDELYENQESPYTDLNGILHNGKANRNGHVLVDQLQTTLLKAQNAIVDKSLPLTDLADALLDWHQNLGYAVKGTIVVANEMVKLGRLIDHQQNLAIRDHQAVKKAYNMLASSGLASTNLFKTVELLFDSPSQPKTKKSPHLNSAGRHPRTNPQEPHTDLRKGPIQRVEITKAADRAAKGRKWYAIISHDRDPAKTTFAMVTGTNPAKVIGFGANPFYLHKENLLVVEAAITEIHAETLIGKSLNQLIETPTLDGRQARITAIQPALPNGQFVPNNLNLPYAFIGSVIREQRKAQGLPALNYEHIFETENWNRYAGYRKPHSGIVSESIVDTTETFTHWDFNPKGILYLYLTDPEGTDLLIADEITEQVAEITGIDTDAIEEDDLYRILAKLLDD